MSGQWLGGNGVKCVHILVLILALLSAVRVCVCVFVVTSAKVLLFNNLNCLSASFLPLIQTAFVTVVSEWQHSIGSSFPRILSINYYWSLLFPLSLLVTPARLAVDRPLIVT